MLSDKTDTMFFILCNDLESGVGLSSASYSTPHRAGLMDLAGSTYSLASHVKIFNKQK
jgi:hypothetical protein